MSNRRVCNRCVPHILHESMEAHMHGTHDSSPTLHDLATAHVAVLAFPRRAASWILRRLDRDGPPLPLIASEVPRHTRAAVASLAQCCGLYDQVRDELTLVGVAEVLAEVAPPPRPNRAPVCRACVLCTSCSVQFHHYAVRAACSGAGVQELVSELRQRTNRALSAAQQLALHSALSLTAEPAVTSVMSVASVTTTIAITITITMTITILMYDAMCR